MTTLERTSDMVLVPAGTFWMGSEDGYADEAPVHQRDTQAFLLDSTPVTNAEFARFVEATGHITSAERAPAWAGRGASPTAVVAGSAVFHPAKGPVDLTTGEWWTFVPGACWWAPEGPGSDVRDRSEHPVVHVSHGDASAYARWCGKRLPTEAEWERAARGGLDRQEFAWGVELEPGGVPMANTWPNDCFPTWDGTGDRPGTTPVGIYPTNGYGLFDMIGNVWEWTTDRYEPQHVPPGACCGSHGASTDPLAVVRPTLVLKGGSYLCASNFCRRYRPAARIPLSADDTASNVGFRCAADVRSGERPGERPGVRPGSLPEARPDFGHPSMIRSCS